MWLHSFEDAVIACKDVSNNHWADYERTYQDKCIDEFFRVEKKMVL